MAQLVGKRFELGLSLDELMAFYCISLFALWMLLARKVFGVGFGACHPLPVFCSKLIVVFWLEALFQRLHGNWVV